MTCNGLQHLSAMGLDPVGAFATNLRASQPRQDIYMEVAQLVQKKVEEDAAKGHPEALQWHGKVDRKTVKRAVMTTPYGVTDRGIRTQLIADGHLDDLEGPKGPAADYLRDCMTEALSQAVSGAKGIMAWLQTTAHSLAKAEVPFDWVTPTGSLCRQAYYQKSTYKIETLCGDVWVDQEDPNGQLNHHKQALGSAPNFVHSFDASHLALTVARANESGMRSFAMIHDSYGTHARNTSELGVILRQAFVDIYKDDWLARTAEYVHTYAPHVSLPPLPARGDFDVSEVLDAEFFFS